MAGRMGTKMTDSLLLRNGILVRPGMGSSGRSAIVVRRGRIERVGPDAEAAELIRPGMAEIDLRGGFVYPGFHDCHCHLMQFGRTLRQLALRQATSFDDIVELCRRRAAELGPGQWILGRGYEDDRWTAPFPGHEPLSRATPDNPVLLTRVDGHAGIANAKALQIAGIDRYTRDPPNGRIGRLPNREPSGLLLDAAKGLVQQHVPMDEHETQLRDLRAAMGHLNAVGLTCVHDMGCDAQTRSLCEEAARAGEMTLRVQAYVPGNEMEELPGPLPGLAGGMLDVRGVKLFVDGALGSRGAALFEPYHDEPDNSGVVHCDEDRLVELIVAAALKGLQPAVHAIGDRGNHILLNAVERACLLVPSLHRPRDEHAQVLTPQDLRRLAQLGVIASMQFRHGTSDMLWAEARLGPERVTLAYAWGAIRRTGVRIAGGSDFPVEPPDPIGDFYAAVTRRDAQDRPGSGWFPEHCLSREDALRSLTLDAAYAAHAETELGVINSGRQADFTVLDRDLLTTPVDEILLTKVLLTIVAGRVVYDSSA